MALRASLLARQLRFIGIRSMSSEWGSGAGKGGGTGGSVRDAGGSFGKMEAAHEEQYFRKLREQQLKELKQHLEEEVDYHEKEIQEHQESIERHKKRISSLHESEAKSKKKGSDSD